MSHLRGEVGKVQGQVDRTRATVENAVTFCETAHLRFQVGGIFERREVARLMGIRYTLLDGAVRIEPNPILLHLRQVTGSDSGNIEPLEKGSHKAKETSEKSKVSIGAPGGTKIEPQGQREQVEDLKAWFRILRETGAEFPA